LSAVPCVMTVYSCSCPSRATSLRTSFTGVPSFSTADFSTFSSTGCLKKKSSLSPTSGSKRKVCSAGNACLTESSICLAFSGVSSAMRSTRMRNWLSLSLP